MYGLGLGKDFLGKTPKAHAKKGKKIELTKVLDLQSKGNKSFQHSLFEFFRHS